MKGLLIGFGMLTALVVAGLAVLPEMTATAWVGQSLPESLAGVWLAWLFALWGALVFAIVFVGVWVAQSLAAADHRRALGISADEMMQPPTPMQRPEPAASRSSAA